MSHESRRQAMIFTVGALAAKCLHGQITGTDPAYNRPPVTVGGPDTVGRKNPQAAAQDYEKNLEDLDKLATMVKQLKEDLGNRGPSTISTSAVKNADQIQKLAKKVHDRLKGKLN